LAQTFVGGKAEYYKIEIETYLGVDLVGSTTEFRDK
jgi:hypothetical protein